MFYEQMNMIRIHCHVNDLDVEILAGLTDNPIERKRDHLLDQNLPAIFWREDYRARQK